MRFVALYGFALRFLTPADGMIMQDTFAACLGLPPFNDTGWSIQDATWISNPLAGIVPLGRGDHGSLLRKAGVVWAFIAHNIKWPQAVRGWMDYVAKHSPSTPEAIVAGLESVVDLCDGQAWADEFSALQGFGVPLTGLGITACSLGLLKRGNEGTGRIVRLGGQGNEHCLQAEQSDTVAVVRQWLALAPELVHPSEPVCNGQPLHCAARIRILGAKCRRTELAWTQSRRSPGTAH